MGKIDKGIDRIRTLLSKLRIADVKEKSATLNWAWNGHVCCMNLTKMGSYSHLVGVGERPVDITDQKEMPVSLR